MKKTILAALLFYASLFSQAMKQEPMYFRTLRQPSSYVTTFTVVGTGQDTTEAFYLLDDGSLQYHIPGDSTSGDSVNVKIVLQITNFSNDIASFKNFQTVVTAETDTGWNEPKPLFSPVAQWGRFIIIGNAANDTTTIDKLRYAGVPKYE